MELIGGLGACRVRGNLDPVKYGRGKLLHLNTFDFCVGLGSSFSSVVDDSPVETVFRAHLCPSVPECYHLGVPRGDIVQYVDVRPSSFRF